MVSRGIWVKYSKCISKFTKISQATTVIFGEFWNIMSRYYPKYPKETVPFPVYTTRQRNFTLYVNGIIFTCKYFKFGSNTTGLSQSNFRNLSVCSITPWIVLCSVLFKVDRLQIIVVAKKYICVVTVHQ